MMESVIRRRWIATLSCVAALGLTSFSGSSARAQSPTTITTAPALNPAPIDQSDPIVVTVAGSNPTGTVTFYDESASPAATLGTLAISNGTAVYYLSMLALGAGSHLLVASYSGDTNNAPSTSDGFTQVVNIPGTTVSSLSVESSLNPAVYGKSVTLTAHLSPASATGTVTFLYQDSSVAIGTVSIVSSKAAITLPNSPVGLRPIMAVYSGDATYKDSTFVLNQNICLAPTALTLTSSKNPANSGDSVTLKTTVNKTLATGSVDFYDGTNGTDYGSVAISGGKADLVASLPDGDHYIIAQYIGDGNYAPSSSAILQVVGTAAGPITPTRTTLTSSKNPALTTDTLTFTATVNSASATGYVNFSYLSPSGSGFLGSVPLVNGVATVTAIGLTSNSTVTASYGGDSTYATSEAVITEVIVPNSTKITVTSTDNPAPYGEPVTLTATLTGANPQGLVSFLDIVTGSFFQTFVSGPTATCLLSDLYRFTPQVGTHSILVFYGGDQNDAPANSAAFNQVITLAPTTTILTSSGSPSYASDPVTFTATISSPDATGQVVFVDTTTGGYLGQSTLYGGVATLTTYDLSVGTHVISAQYSGDYANAASSANRTQVVKLHSTTTSLNSSLNPSSPGQPVTLTATVSLPNATGIMTFTDTTTGIQIGATPIYGGTATLTTGFALGSHVLTAQYSGDGSCAPSTGTRTQVVKLIPTTTVLATSVSPSSPNQLVTFTATVNAPYASGSVTFTDTTTGNGIAIVQLNNGTATISTTSLAVGSHVITAQYSGDTDFAPSSASRTQVVKLVETKLSLQASPNPSTSSQSVTFTATLDTTFATGFITFTDTTAGIPLTTTSVYNGVGVATLPPFTSGSHVITATYLGDGTYAASTKAITEVVH